MPRHAGVERHRFQRQDGRVRFADAVARGAETALAAQAGAQAEALRAQRQHGPLAQRRGGRRRAPVALEAFGARRQHVHGMQAARPQSAGAGAGQVLLAPVGTRGAQRFAGGRGGLSPHFAVARLFRRQQGQALLAQGNRQAAFLQAGPVAQHGPPCRRMLHEMLAQFGQPRLHPRRHLPGPAAAHLFLAQPLRLGRIRQDVGRIARDEHLGTAALG